MSYRRKQGGLIFIVHYGNMFQHQVLASCNDLTVGPNPSLPTFSSVIEGVQANCDGKLFQFSITGNEVKVIKNADGAKQTVVDVILPENVQSFTYGHDLEKFSIGTN